MAVTAAPWRSASKLNHPSHAPMSSTRLPVKSAGIGNRAYLLRSHSIWQKPSIRVPSGSSKLWYQPFSASSWLKSLPLRGSCICSIISGAAADYTGSHQHEHPFSDCGLWQFCPRPVTDPGAGHRSGGSIPRSEEHTSELQSRQYLVCRLLLEKKN